MLKGMYISGTYRDENITVSVTLKNPIIYGYDASALLLSIMLSAKGVGAVTPSLEDCAFYIMDEANQLYNARCVPLPSVAASSEDDEILRQPDGLILTDFKHDFLFQDMRIAFYYRPYETISIIELKY